LLAGFERLLIEKIRVNARYDVFGVAVTQAEIISCLLVAAGLFGVLITLRTRRELTKAAFTVAVLVALTACAPL